MIQETAHASLGEWESYYVIVGSSAAALTGLQFVVITLVADVRGRTSGNEIGAFATPTIVHFCIALLVSATLSAPWPRLGGPALVIGACGLFGLGYTARVVFRATRQTGYRMVAEDWIWHVILPIAAYVAVTTAAVRLIPNTMVSLFAVAGSTLLLVFIGIHNAWDTTTFVAAGRLGTRADSDGEGPAAPASSGAKSEQREPAPPASSGTR